MGRERDRQTDRGRDRHAERDGGRDRDTKGWREGRREGVRARAPVECPRKPAQAYMTEISNAEGASSNGKTTVGSANR